MKKITEKDCLLEIERIARLIAFSRQDTESLEQCRKCLSASLAKVAELRVEAEKRRQANAANDYAKKMGFQKSKDTTT